MNPNTAPWLNDVRAVLTRTIWISVRFFVPLWSIPAIFVLPIVVLFELLSSYDESHRIDYQHISTACCIVVIAVSEWMIMGEIVEVHRGGRASLSAAFRKISLSGILNLAAINVVFWIATGALLFTIWLPVVLVPLLLDTRADAVIPWALGLGGLAFLTVSVLFLFSPQLVVIERLFFWTALKRSVSLVLPGGAGWRFAVATILIYLGFQALVFAPSYRDAINDINDISSQLLRTTGSEQVPARGPASSLPSRIASAVISAASMPFLIIFVTLAYLSMRDRTQSSSND